MSPSPSPNLSRALWAVQALLALTFIGSGIWKGLTPTPELAKMIPWAGDVSPGFLHFIVLVDVLGGIGLLLPALTRIQPWLTWLAAIGCALLQASAIAFHLSRGEGANTPFNFVLVGLSLFVAWGRRGPAPIPSR